MLELLGRFGLKPSGSRLSASKKSKKKWNSRAVDIALQEGMLLHFRNFKNFHIEILPMMLVGRSRWTPAVAAMWQKNNESDEYG